MKIKILNASYDHFKINNTFDAAFLEAIAEVEGSYKHVFPCKID